jgi:hypothetical protein
MSGETPSGLQCTPECLASDCVLSFRLKSLVVHQINERLFVALEQLGVHEILGST